MNLFTGDFVYATWISSRIKQRTYANDVLTRIDALRARFDVAQYGQVEYQGEAYPLFAVRSHNWNDALPVALVTGGVHGYETSGVQGRVDVPRGKGRGLRRQGDLLVAPCVSPWAYEHIQRWNADAIDPNRSFRVDSPAGESAALMQLVVPLQGRMRVHIDLHETTDSDETKSRCVGSVAPVYKRLAPNPRPQSLTFVTATSAFQDLG